MKKRKDLNVIYGYIQEGYLQNKDYQTIANELNDIGLTSTTGKKFTLYNVSFIARKVLNFANRKKRVVNNVDYNATDTDKIKEHIQLPLLKDSENSENKTLNEINLKDKDSEMEYDMFSLNKEDVNKKIIVPRLEDLNLKSKRKVDLSDLLSKLLEYINNYKCTYNLQIDINVSLDNDKLDLSIKNKNNISNKQDNELNIESNHIDYRKGINSAIVHIAYKNNSLNDSTDKKIKDYYISSTWTMIKKSFDNRLLSDNTRKNFSELLLNYNNHLAKEGTNKGILKPINYLDIVEMHGKLKDLYLFVKEIAKSFN